MLRPDWNEGHALRAAAIVVDHARRRPFAGRDDVPCSQVRLPVHSMPMKVAASANTTVVRIIILVQPEG